MTRKDFELIAETLKGTKPAAAPNSTLQAKAYDQWVHTCEAFADALRRTNPRFQRSKFLAACGIV